MSEFFAAILSPVNFALTVLLVCFMFYWLVVMFGMTDLDAFDVDVDVDTDVDAPSGGSAVGGGMMGILKFLNVGEVPLMVLLSTFALVMWTIGVLAHIFVGAWSIGVQLLALIPMAVIAVLLTKILTQPAKRVFAKMDESAAAGSVEVLGQRCLIISATADHRHGQAEIKTAGAPVKINVKTPSQEIVLLRGSEAVVVNDRDENGVYIIRGF